MEQEEPTPAPPKRQQRRRKLASGVNGNGRNKKLVIESEYGPAMSRLTVLQQKYVETLVDRPQLNRTKALQAAGYDGTLDGAKQMAHRLMNNPDVLDGIA